jgi:hypothetical protein
MAVMFREFHICQALFESIYNKSAKEKGHGCYTMPLNPTGDSLELFDLSDGACWKPKTFGNVLGAPMSDLLVPQYA